MILFSWLGGRDSYNVHKKAFLLVKILVGIQQFFFSVALCFAFLVLLVFFHSVVVIVVDIAIVTWFQLRNSKPNVSKI